MQGGPWQYCRQAAVPFRTGTGEVEIVSDANYYHTPWVSFRNMMWHEVLGHKPAHPIASFMDMDRRHPNVAGHRSVGSWVSLCRRGQCLWEKGCVGARPGQQLCRGQRHWTSHALRKQGTAWNLAPAYASLHASFACWCLQVCG